MLSSLHLFVYYIYSPISPIWETFKETNKQVNRLKNSALIPRCLLCRVNEILIVGLRWFSLFVTLISNLSYSDQMVWLIYKCIEEKRRQMFIHHFLLKILLKVGWGATKSLLRVAKLLQAGSNSSRSKNRDQTTMKLLINDWHVYKNG